MLSALLLANGCCRSTHLHDRLYDKLYREGWKSGDTIYLEYKKSLLGIPFYPELADGHRQPAQKSIA